MNLSESNPNISNPVYDSLPATKEQTPTVSESNVREAANTQPSPDIPIYMVPVWLFFWEPKSSL